MMSLIHSRSEGLSHPGEIRKSCSSSFKRNSVLSICLNMFSLALLNHGRINVLVDKIPFYSLLIPYE